MTHLFCASCGSTRALGILARGNLLEAMRMNALACLAAGYLIAASAVCLLTGAWRLGPSLSARSALTLGVLILLFMVLRNIRVIPFIYLAPSG